MCAVDGDALQDLRAPNAPRQAHPLVAVRLGERGDRNLPGEINLRARPVCGPQAQAIVGTVSADAQLNSMDIDDLSVLRGAARKYSVTGDVK